MFKETILSSELLSINKADKEKFEVNDNNKGVKRLWLTEWDSKKDYYEGLLWTDTSCSQKSYSGNTTTGSRIAYETSDFPIVTNLATEKNECR